MVHETPVSSTWLILLQPRCIYLVLYLMSYTKYPCEYTVVHQASSLLPMNENPP